MLFWRARIYSYSKESLSLWPVDRRKFSENPLDHLCARIDIVQFLQWLDFAEHPESGAIVKDSDPQTLGEKIEVTLQPGRRMIVTATEMLRIELEPRRGAILVPNDGPANKESENQVVDQVLR
jgi:hypothetical protein